ncbi:hypothetical protein B0A55_01890 [Friedmanniomyces simplex]|uniref:Protein LURP-one-related 15 n=1 Tax=Friedmanniomyces simplex TaxID=329884 RepID=A0A4U0XUU5_9PEZI|nr:hypothetical protein B0A55_01890 [Friedmanniomyces simplex]
MAPHLSPCTPALGPQPVSAQLYSPNQTTLVMKEKVFSLTGDDFTVRTVDGLDICKCKGKMVSAHDSKKFTDTTGTELFTLKNKMLSLHKSFHGDSPHGRHDFAVKGHFKLVGSRSTVEFKNASDGTEVELEVKGDWMDRSAAITFAGREVAKISRSFFNVRELMGDKQTYQVTVAANVDLSLIAAICVSLDERETEEGK